MKQPPVYVTQGIDEAALAFPKKYISSVCPKALILTFWKKKQWQ